LVLPPHPHRERFRLEAGMAPIETAPTGTRRLMRSGCDAPLEGSRIAVPNFLPLLPRYLVAKPFAG
jgi:hypothetical protein